MYSYLLDPQHFAYRSYRTVDNTVTLTLHLAVSHLYTPNTYVCMLFIDFSSAINTVIPTKIFSKLIDAPIEFLKISFQYSFAQQKCAPKCLLSSCFESPISAGSATQ